MWLNIRSRLEDEMLVVYSPNQAPEIETKTENHNRFLLLGDLTEKEATSEDGDAGLIGKMLAWPGQTIRVAPADDDAAKAGEEPPAAVSETTRQPSGPPTRLEAAVSSGFTNLTRVIEEQVVKNEPGVSDYALLAKVLDRLCLVLYVASVTLAVPMTIYLGK
uniref:Neurotransmitter-gated ion-channel transmembrane domain-containing protein n=1 Tax=Branchiostoma floridae TaxID=7739 RepID=C3YRP0_BRAFL|eukprot:XP_002600783.1 hypothetical protein BRAFLDRAFT_95069 [Branchiostoma floridae]